MPGEVIDRPNPQPVASNVPDDVLSLVVKLEKTKLDEGIYTGLQHFRRAANYIAAGTQPVLLSRPRPCTDISIASHDLPARQRVS